VQGWSCYWKPRRQQQQQQQQQHSHDAQTGWTAALEPLHRLETSDYLLAPLDAVVQFNVAQPGSSSSSSSTPSSMQPDPAALAARASCQVFIGATEVAMQLSTQQLVGMARVADDAAVWAKRECVWAIPPARMDHCAAGPSAEQGLQGSLAWTSVQAASAGATSR